MKVIEIMDNLALAGGVNSFVYDLCAALKSINADVTLIAIMKNYGASNETVQQLKKKGIDVVCIGAANKKEAILKYIPKLRREILRISNGEQTVCNLHLKLSVLMGSIATIGCSKIKCVETYHSRYSKYWLENFILQSRIKKYIACSESANREMKKRFTVKKSKIITIPNGVDCELIKKSKANPSDTTITAISAGRFTEQKNFQITTKAFSSLCSDRIRYTIYGDGELKDEIISNKDNNNYISICTPLDRFDLLRQVSKSNIVVMPSLWEGLSIFLLEAMALGKPLMLSDVDSFRWVMSEKKLEHNETWRLCKWGFLVSNSSVEGYISSLEYFANHPELEKTMSKEVEKISKRYDINTTAKSYLKQYSKLFE